MEAQTDLLAGRVQVMFDPIISAIGHVRAGKLRALAVTTATRSSELLDVPTVAETVPGYVASQWYGITAPKGTPPEVIQRLGKEINAVVADASLKARFSSLGVDLTAMTSTQFADFIAAETERWGKVVEAAGIDIASVVSYLAGPEAAYVTGANWNVDGGITV